MIHPVDRFIYFRIDLPQHIHQMGAHFYCGLFAGITQVPERFFCFGSDILHFGRIGSIFDGSIKFRHH